MLEATPLNLALVTLALTAWMLGLSLALYGLGIIVDKVSGR